MAAATTDNDDGDDDEQWHDAGVGCSNGDERPQRSKTTSSRSDWTRRYSTMMMRTMSLVLLLLADSDCLCSIVDWCLLHLLRYCCCLCCSFRCSAADMDRFDDGCGDRQRMTICNHSTLINCYYYSLFESIYNITSIILQNNTKMTTSQVV